MNTFFINLYSFIMSYVFSMKSTLVSETGASEFDDGGSSSWVRNVAVGFAIVFLLYVLIKAFMPDMVDAWKAKVLSFFDKVS